MRIVVASGKGGTGKTTVAIALAQVAAEDTSRSVHLLDCDVEAPDVAVSLDLEWSEEKVVGPPAPVVDLARCTQCGACADACAFGALAVVGEQVLVFDALCHGCGRCVNICPEHAISERRRDVGRVSAGRAGPIAVSEGRLKVGEIMAVPVIRALRRWRRPTFAPDDLVIYDAPPGTTCPLVETLHGADVVVLVTEPTPFGLHDLEAAVGAVRATIDRPIFVVLNRDDGLDSGVERYCEREGIPIALRLPFERRVATAAADAIPLLTVMPSWRGSFDRLLYRLQARSAA